ncbi:hypothetical protein ACH5RR_010205 [Cinchona calisaya]|uniref:Protein EARLY FLOWERING 4 domain-containing protein n=1 Tax=Cinchona calisaya TaxID=153742 RepID=A0ABD3AIK7_9GENT
MEEDDDASKNLAKKYRLSRVTDLRFNGGEKKNGNKEDAEDEDGNEDEGECDVRAWETLNKSFKDVQSVLDQNRVLINQVNENHQSKVAANLVENVALIREINGHCFSGDGGDDGTDKCDAYVVFSFGFIVSGSWIGKEGREEERERERTGKGLIQGRCGLGVGVYGKELERPIERPVWDRVNGILTTDSGRHQRENIRRLFPR